MLTRFSSAAASLTAAVLLTVACFVVSSDAAEPFIPRKQTKPPTPALSPAEAIKKMTVPPGFAVELVAAEPDVVNPVAMTFDERGRIWITESFEYPRKQAGPGRDRVKILEDADGDGSAERVTIFAEGLNIPSGIAVGAGGVWVANAPDILFYPDADRDGRADGPPQQVLTGFGRDDTHELPNSLTWGPDGWLYGLNGVFNASHVRYGKDNPNFAQAETDKHPGWKITCAMFRIHPRTREFQVFCEGTSNPWGIAFNDNGDAFVSACVIDHLWHLVETGYYHRQGGPYPPHTWKLESIVDYKHQMAAYCGITWFDSDAYPEQYRKKLYMGNIHGGCINVDGLERNGATYKGVKHDDFLTANDVWFMPVVQKVGPDGCLYILDWYDRYHCYQDANYDPPGVDRAKGRLYRVRYKETPRAPKFDLAAETDDQLIERLASPNIYFREQAQRMLAERSAGKQETPAIRLKLEVIALDGDSTRPAYRHALWARLSGGPLDARLADQLSKHESAFTRTWLARALGDNRHNGVTVQEILPRLANDSSIDVRLQALIAAGKALSVDQAIDVIVAAAAKRETSALVLPNDPLLPAVTWRNLLPLLPANTAAVLRTTEQGKWQSSLTLIRVWPKLIDWLAAQGVGGINAIADFLDESLDQPQGKEVLIDDCLTSLADKLAAGEIVGPAESTLRARAEAKLLALTTAGSENRFGLQAALVLAHWKHPSALRQLRNAALELNNDDFRGTNLADEIRLPAIAAWAASGDLEMLKSLPDLVLPNSVNSPASRRRALESLSKFESSDVGKLVLKLYSELEDETRPIAVELLTSRTTWARQLLDAVAVGTVAKDAVNVNQIRKLLKLGDKELTSRVEATWGKLRTDRNPQREQVVAKMRDLVRNGHGDPLAGQAVFGRLCGQCHKIHGAGQDVGPDITVNGRSNFDQLLSNIFDPSLVIGAAYQPRIVTTGDGRVLTGLLVEDGPQRVVLKLQGGKLETIPRSNVDEIETSKLSLMPEGVETQYKPQEIVDLFAFLKLDKPPTDPSAKTLPGFAELDKK